MEDKVMDGYMKALRSIAISDAVESLDEVERTLTSALSDLRNLRGEFMQRVYSEDDHGPNPESGSDVMIWIIDKLEQIDVKSRRLAQAAVKLSRNGL